MARDIAVFQGVNGETASVYEQGKMVVYRRAQGSWEIIREKECFIGSAKGMAELRKQVAEALLFLADCKVFVGLSVVGVPYYELEKAEISVWEFEGRPADFLDYILEKEEEAFEKNPAEQDLAAKTVEQFGPVETSKGCYFISLKEIQANNAGITSKQVLLPFLRREVFYSLEVLCNHVPPWLEAELEGELLSGHSEKINQEEVRVVITKKTCGEIRGLR